MTRHVDDELLGIILWIAGSMTWSLFYIFGGIAGLAIFVQLILHHQRCGKLDADADGLILRPPGGEPKRIRYEDILEIRATTGWTWQHQDLMYVADLVTADGVALMLRYLDTEVVEVLWPVLLEKVACPIGDRVLARLRQGKEASFGELVLRREGFSIDEKSIRWDDVRLTLFTTDGIRVLFRDPDRPEMLLPRQTPNLHAFMHVLWSMRKQRDDLRMGKRDTLVFLSDQDGGDALDIEEIHERTRFPRVPGFPKKDPDLGRVLFGMKPRKWMTYSMIAAYVVMVGLTIFGFTMAVLGAPPFDRIRSLSLDAGYCTFKVSSSRAPVATISTDAWNFPIFYALFKKLLAEETRDSRRGDAERA